MARLQVIHYFQYFAISRNPEQRVVPVDPAEQLEQRVTPAMAAIGYPFPGRIAMIA